MTLRTTALSVFTLLMAASLAAAQNGSSAADDSPRADARAPETRTAPGTSAPPADAAAPRVADVAEDDPDLDVNLAQPDFALSALPTTLRLPKFKTVYRMTHRFYEPFSDAGLGGVFGLDSGAMVGLEFRAGLAPGLQAIFYRTSDKTIQFAGQYNVVQQGRLPVTVAAHASVEGTNNFQDSYTPAFGLIISREVGTRAALYVEPVWVNNSNPLPKALIEHNDSMLIGIGARVRVLETTYLVGEVVPRVNGFDPGDTQISFGLEKRAGGHLFQLTFSNSVGTTWGQLARGAAAGQHWVMGFNLTRKFY